VGDQGYQVEAELAEAELAEQLKFQPILFLLIQLILFKSEPEEFILLLKIQVEIQQDLV